MRYCTLTSVKKRKVMLEGFEGEQYLTEQCYSQK